VVLDARACAFMFADNTVVRNLVWMLEGYRGNTVQVNYYIGRMLERVSKDCELEPMLYQVRNLPCYRALIQRFRF
jgi:timeless